MPVGNGISTVMEAGSPGSNDRGMLMDALNNGAISRSRFWDQWPLFSTVTSIFTRSPEAYVDWSKRVEITGSFQSIIVHTCRPYSSTTLNSKTYSPNWAGGTVKGTVSVMLWAAAKTNGWGGSDWTELSGLVIFAVKVAVITFREELLLVAVTTRFAATPGDRVLGKAAAKISGLSGIVKLSLAAFKLLPSASWAVMEKTAVPNCAVGGTAKFTAVVTTAAADRATICCS